MTRTWVSIMPGGLLVLIVIAVVVILAVKAIMNSKDAVKVIGAILAVAALMVMLLVVGGGLLFYQARSVAYEQKAEQQARRQTSQLEAQAAIERAKAVEQADDAAMRAQSKVDQTQAQVQAQIDAHAEAVSQRVLGQSMVPGPEDPPNPGRLPDATHAQTTTDASAPAASESSVATASGNLLVAGAPWTNAVEEHQDFEADVYPSMTGAAEALGRRVGDRLLETEYAQATEHKSIYVWYDQDVEYVSRDVLEAVATGLRQKVADPKYVSVERPASPDAVAVRLAVQDITFEQHNRWHKHTETTNGAIALRVKTPAGDFSLSTRFRDTPWITDRSGFASQYSSGDWIVAYSDSTDTSHDGAQQDAMLAAADALLPMARARINQLSASDQARFNKQMAQDPDWLRDRVADELVARNDVVDRFAQRFDRPYGTVWREAVLVDADENAVGQIARSLVQGLNVRVSHQRSTWFSFIALVGLIFGTYLFLNMATKGYYALALRLAAIGGIIVVGLLVSMIA